jgi:hypothetical protein
METTEPVVCKSFEAEIARANWKGISPGRGQTLTELKQDVKHLCSEIHELINSICNNEELPEYWKKSYYCTTLQEGRLNWLQ